jgi:hypothetical protein
MTTYYERAIANIKADKTSDGVGLPPRLFANDRVREAFAAAARTVCEIVARSIKLTPARQMALVQIIANHRSYRGKQTARAYAGLVQRASELADAIIERPQVIDLRLNTRSILADHANSSAAAAQRLAGRATTTLPPTLIVPDADPAFTLVELTSAQHLQAESAALKHCVGTTHNSAALRAKGLQPTDPGAEEYLHYAIKIRQKKTRIFSLRHKGRPVATVEYDVATQSIVQIEGNPRSITGKESFFPALCRTLHALYAKVPLNSILGLPALPDRMVLIRDGRISPFTPELLPDVLTGTVSVYPRTPDSLLSALLACPRLIVNVTHLDLTRLPAHVRANLKTAATSFSAPQLQTAKAIYARSATSFSAPQLQTAGNIVADSATSFSAPQLQTAGIIHVDSATSFSVPQLQTAEGIYARSATSFSAAQLQTAGTIFAVRATSFSAPRLQTAEDIDANSATSFSAPQLQTAGIIHADSATSFSAPRLQTAKAIYAGSAFSFSTPQLQTAGTIDVPKLLLPTVRRLLQVSRIA